MSSFGLLSALCRPPVPSLLLSHTRVPVVRILRRCCTTLGYHALHAAVFNSHAFTRSAAPDTHLDTHPRRCCTTRATTRCRRTASPTRCGSGDRRSWRWRCRCGQGALCTYLLCCRKPNALLRVRPPVPFSPDNAAVPRCLLWTSTLLAHANLYCYNTLFNVKFSLISTHARRAAALRCLP